MAGRTPLAVLTRDGRLLFATRIARLFAYGFLSVVLVLYLVEIGFGALEVGALLTLTLVGDAAISLWLTTHADRIGRRRVLLAGRRPDGPGGRRLPAVARSLGPRPGRDDRRDQPERQRGRAVPGGRAGRAVADRRRPRADARLRLVQPRRARSPPRPGRWRRACSAQALQATGATLSSTSYRAVILGYALDRGRAGGALLARSRRRSRPRSAADVSVATPPRAASLARRRGPARRRCSRSTRSAAASSSRASSLLVPPGSGCRAGALGALFFGANLLAGISALLAAPLAARIGLINTMVFTHLPSNVLLILVPLMPTLPLAIAVLLLRFSISQMDVPTRQSYTMAVVDPDERSAAAGVTGIARSVGAAVSPSIAAPLRGRGRSRRPAVRHRRRPQDRLRPAALPELPGPAAAGGGGRRSGGRRSQPPTPKIDPPAHRATSLMLRGRPRRVGAGKGGSR